MSAENKFNELVKLFNETARVPGLKLKGLPDDYPRDPVQFLINFFSSYNLMYDTVNENGALVTDTKNGYGRNRSVQEIYDVLTSYFDGPANYQLKQYFQDLFAAAAYFASRAKINIYLAGTPTQYSQIDYSTPILYAMWCPTIRKDVIWVTHNYPLNPKVYLAAPSRIFPFYFMSSGTAPSHASCKIWHALVDEELQEYLLGDKYVLTNGIKDEIKDSKETKRKGKIDKEDRVETLGMEYAHLVN